MKYIDINHGDTEALRRRVSVPLCLRGYHIFWVCMIAAMLFLSGTAWSDCSVTSTALGFGNYDPLQSPSAGVTGEITVVCDPGAAYTILLDAGANSGGVFSSRRMLSSSGSVLKYNIYRDAARTEIWGDGTNSTYTQAGVGTGAAQRYVVHGHIPPRQKPPAGVYSDATTIKVNW